MLDCFNAMRLFSALLLVSLNTFGGAIVSTFDANSDGWLVADDGANTAVTYVAAGGHPGGAIQRQDADLNGYMHFQAPAKFLGNLTPYFNGTLSYDLLQTVRDTDTTWYYRELLQGAGMLILHTVGLTPDTANWRHFDVPLNAAAGWIAVPTIEDFMGAPVTDAQFQAVLAGDLVGHLAEQPGRLGVRSLEQLGAAEGGGFD